MKKMPAFSVCSSSAAARNSQKLLLAVLASVYFLSTTAQPVIVSKALFQKGDNMEWANPNFNDASWNTLDITRSWDVQQQSIENDYAWYRIHVLIPSSLLKKSNQQKLVVFDMPKADDADECYLNGRLIGKTGSMPIDKGGYSSAWNVERTYMVDAKNGGIRWDDDNIIAVRVYNGPSQGGLFGRPLSIRMPDAIEGISLQFHDNYGEKAHCIVDVNNAYPITTPGTLSVNIQDRETGQTLTHLTRKVNSKQGKVFSVNVPYDKSRTCLLNATFTDSKTGLSVKRSLPLKYVLTPAPPAAPRFNGAPLFGVRTASPVIYRFPVSGERPMTFSAKDLPQGVTLSETDGVLSGSVSQPGDYSFTVTAENTYGKQQQTFTLRVGDRMMALTPPMGWNSWNCWGLSVTQDKVMASAQALIDKGLADYGYCYINIDDGWEAPERNADGTIAVNEKFPSMSDLGNWLHQRGLKFGIYSSPGDYTCGGFLGSIDHEQQDAETYAQWGIDYLKYDWCGYSKEHAKEKDQSVASYIRPYLLMQQYLREQPRDIFYSLCQYGMANVWEWGPFVDANSWRTTGDIEDSWQSLYNIGFDRQAKLAPYSSPGHWNDPDMLVVGKVGWSANLRDSRLTPDEQYTHISLWALLAANMLIGCDISQMDDFTVSLLCNHEVNAVNQDILGKRADRILKDGDIEVWTRPLVDGTHAVGIFNVGEKDLDVDLIQYVSTDNNAQLIRDLWRQKNLSPSETKCTIPSHGCRLLKVTYTTM